MIAFYLLIVSFERRKKYEFYTLKTTVVILYMYFHQLGFVGIFKLQIVLVGSIYLSSANVIRLQW